MSVVQVCPYSRDGENCKYEIYYGHPIFDKCPICPWYKKALFTGDLDLEDVQKDSLKPFRESESSDNLDYKHIKLDTLEDNKLSLSEIQEYAHKLFKSFDNLSFKSNFNYALQAFYLEEGLYVVRSKSLNSYQYTLVEADSEEQAIRKCF